MLVRQYTRPEHKVIAGKISGEVSNIFGHEAIMYIGKIELKNIRGFEDLKFDLVRGDGSFAGWTVFTGDNGFVGYVPAITADYLVPASPK